MRVRRRTLPDLATDLENRLTRLLDDLALDAWDRSGAQAEPDYFRLVDRAAADPDAAPILERVGERFAACFVAPYLHADDLAGVLVELGGLLEIHHRGGLTVEALEGDRAVVTFRTPGHADGHPTPFDVALVDAALLARFRSVEMRPVRLGDAGGGAARRSFEIVVKGAVRGR